ncbi:MAG: bacterial Ig-like domain-containing protein, partial [Clostridia bacterium]|nr:bacterial Ig-like domain-containing protein [Clostridia bacterium]
SYSGFDSSSAGTKTITVKFSGKTAEFTVTVKEILIENIEITSLPSKTSYYVGEAFSSTGIRVYAVYNNGSRKDVSTKVTYSGFDSSTAGTKTITVSYEEKTAEFDVYIIDNEVSKITITKTPTKTVYYTGEEIDLTGITVIAQYSNGTKEDISSRINSVRNFDNTKEGQQTVEIEYGGKTAAFTVTVNKLEIKQLDLTPPAKTEYFIGEEVDYSGMAVIAVYNSGLKEDVTADVTISGADTSQAGTFTVTASYQTKTASFKITVLKSEVVSITLVEPTKKEYFVGESLDLSGMTVTAYMSDGSSEIVSDKVTVSGFDSTAAGNKTITVSYASKSASFDITVKEKQVEFTGFVITLPLKLNYYVGESFDPYGMEILAAYSDETAEDVTEKATLSGFDSRTAGVKTITVEYNGHTTSFDVTVYDVVLDHISVTPPDKMQYTVGEAPDMTGFSVTAYYSNGSFNDVTDKAAVSGFDTSEAGVKQVNVEYEGMTSSFEIVVLEAVVYLDRIELTPPEKTSYYIGEILDTTGMKVLAYYSDGSAVDVTEFVNVTGFDSQTAGKQVITVEYDSKTAEFEIEVKQAVLTALEINEPDKKEYNIGEELDLTGFVLWAVYDNGEKIRVEDGYAVTGFDSTTAGTKTVTVEYMGISVQ